MGKYKIGAQGNLVGMTLLNREKLRVLERFYAIKWNQARSADMRLAYRESLEQIRRFAYDDEIASNADVFYVTYQADLLDVRSMIKTYFGSLVNFRRGGRELESSTTVLVYMLGLGRSLRAINRAKARPQADGLG